MTVIVHLILFVILVPTSSDEFQEIDGESEERRRARLERHQRTCERAVMLTLIEQFLSEELE